MNKASESYAPNKEVPDISVLRRLSARILDIRDKIIFMLLLETGITVGELTEIKPYDFEFTTNSLIIGQERKRRRVKITLKLSLLLRSYADFSRPYLFSSSLSPQITSRRVEQIVQNIGNQWGFRLSPQKLRKIALTANYRKTRSAVKTANNFGILRLPVKEYLTPAQLNRLFLAASNPKNKAILMLLAETGCKLEELCSIKVRDLNLKARTLALGKAGKKRVVGLSKQLCSLLEKTTLSRLGSEFLFSTRQSECITPKRVFQLVKLSGISAGIRGANPRILRNSAIAAAIQHEIPEAKIQQRFSVHHLGLHHFGLMKKMSENAVAGVRE